jgi:hypothetical protein
MQLNQLREFLLAGNSPVRPEINYNDVAPELPHDLRQVSILDDLHTHLVGRL